MIARRGANCVHSFGNKRFPTPFTSARFTGVESARQISSAVRDEGAGGGLPWSNDCRALNLFNRGGWLQ